MKLNFHPMWFLLFMLFGLIIGSLTYDLSIWSAIIIISSIIGAILMILMPISPSGTIGFDKTFIMTLIVWAMMITMIVVEFKRFFTTI